MTMALFKLPNLMPKEDKFCVILEQLALQAGACAVHLKAFVEAPSEGSRNDSAIALSNARNEAKKLAADMTLQLCRTFVTPFDREDLQDIAADLYKIPKTIEKVKDRIAMHGIALDRGDFVRQINLIVEESEAMKDMVKELTHGKNTKQVQEKITLLYDLEQKGDEILSELLVTLFRDSTDPRDLILRKDIYDMLEKIIDRYRDAAGIALQMVLKHT